MIRPLPVFGEISCHRRNSIASGADLLANSLCCLQRSSVFLFDCVSRLVQQAKECLSSLSLSFGPGAAINYRRCRP